MYIRRHKTGGPISGVIEARDRKRKRRRGDGGDGYADWIGKGRKDGDWRMTRLLWRPPLLGIRENATLWSVDGERSAIVSSYVQSM